MNTITIEPLIKANNTLKQAIELYAKETNSNEEKTAFRDACIQRFEYVIELAWKTAIKYLGSQTKAAKPAIRELARNNLISDVQLWFSFIESRNNTSHSYDEDIAQSVFTTALKLPLEVDALIEKLK